MPAVRPGLKALGLLVILAFSLAMQAQNIISTLAGGGQTPTDPSQADLPGPTSAVSLNGTTYIAAPNSAYVFMLSNGTFGNYAGLGVGGFSGDGGPVGNAKVALPNGLALDSKGNLYIADIGNSRVRVVDQNGNIRTVAGSGVKCEPSTAPCGDGGPATSAQMNFPTSVAIDAAGNIYIADAFDNRVRTVWATGPNAGKITTFAGTGTPCPNPTTACGDGGAATAAELNFPQGVAVDATGNVYIADTNDNRIREIPAGSANIVKFAGDGKACTAPPSCGDNGPAASAHLHSPAGLFVDGAGDVYVADTNDNEIREVPATGSSAGDIIRVAGSGTQGWSGDGGAATTADLNIPSGVFIDSGTGNMLISDTGNQRIRTVSSNTITTLAGGGLGDGPLGTGPGGATFADPNAIAEDAKGNLYVADTANNRVRMISGGSVSTVAGTGIAGYSGDKGPATSATLNGPTDVKLDQNGNLYIADANNLVIRQVNLSTKVITTYAGNGTTCFPTTGNCGDGGAAAGAQFTFPMGIALDTAGDLYVADYNAHRIRRVDTESPPIITTVTGNGQPGFCCNPPQLAVHGILRHPSSVAVDGNGNLFISDSFNNLIRVIGGQQGGPLNCQAGYLCIYMGNGSASLSGDGGPVAKGSMWNPLDLATDPFNNVFISGGNDQVVQRADYVTQTWGTVAGVYATPLLGGYSGDGGLATKARMLNKGVTVDGRQNLYIADAGNNRLRTVHLTPAIAVSTKPIDFGYVPLDTPSAASNLPLQSSGGVDLSLTNISFSGADPGDFSQTNTCGNLPAMLGVDVTCTISITFTPSQYGPRTAMLTLTDNAPSGTQAIHLSGSGPDFSISANPTSITVQQGSSGNSTLTLTPIAGFNQTVSLSILSGCPQFAKCSVVPGSVTLDGIDNGQATFTVSTTSQTPKGPPPNSVIVHAVFKTAQGPLAHDVAITVNVD